MRETKASVFVQAFEAQHLTREGEGVAELQLLDELFLDLAQGSAARQSAHPGSAPPLPRAPDQPDLDHRCLDDGADIHAVLLRQPWVGEAESVRAPIRRNRA